LIVVSGKAKLARLSQLVGVPAMAGMADAASSAIALNAETCAIVERENARDAGTVVMALSPLDAVEKPARECPAPLGTARYLR
jgi:hypothetical protein